ncbi:MAG: export transporter permease LptF [Pseudomonadota bacterium]|jgi:lipopolysaccharide export system permease protein
MSLIERYLFKQLLGPTLLATLALVAVALLSQSLGTLDIMVEQRQSAMVFAKITFLALPQLLNMILPIAIFVASLVALNRLHTEQEIVVCFAGGMSRWRVIAPAIKLASLAMLVTLVVNLWVQPYFYRTMRDELFAVRTDLAATLVRAGEFSQPSSDLTVYAQSIDQQGIMRNMFLNQEKAEGGSTTFFARQGKVAKRNGEPILIMRQGSNQELSSEGVLNFLKFDEYIFNLAPFMNSYELVHYKISDRYMHELMFPDLQQEWEQRNRVKMIAEFHSRLSSPLYNLAFMAMALNAVIGGAFSRLGYGRRIAMIAGVAAFVRILGFGVQAACDDNAALNVLQYAVPLIATWWALAKLFKQKSSRSGGLRLLGARKPDVEWIT